MRNHAQTTFVDPEAEIAEVIDFVVSRAATFSAKCQGSALRAGLQTLLYRNSLRGTAMSNIARDFFTRCFAPGETIAVLLRRENPASTQQRIIAFERALAPRYLGWLAQENATGANVYVAANPLHSGSRKRTKGSIASIRHLSIDIDTDGDARLAALRASDAVPMPTAILFTSPGKYQVLWRVDSFDFESQESTLKLLAIAFGGDPACTD